VRLSNGAFDEAFVADAIDPESARNLLAHRAGDGADAVDLCLWAASNDWGLRVNDEAVALWKTGEIDEANALGHGLDMAAHLAARLGWARRTAPPSARELETVRAWGSVAAARGLAFWSDRMLVVGRLAGVACEIALVAGANLSYCTQGQAYFDKPLQVDLRLGPGDKFSPFDRYMGMVDIHLGDTDFDRVYGVQGAPADRARRLLVKPVRTALLTLLRRNARIEITDAAVRISIPSGLNAAALDMLLTDLPAAAASLQAVSIGH
jgi:hypothetical protein